MIGVRHESGNYTKLPDGMSVECSDLAFILKQGFGAKIRWWEARTVGHFYTLEGNLISEVGCS